MEYRQLGSSGLRVSSLCLGTMTFGEANAESFMHEVGCDEATSFAIMDASLEAGINFFDTADVYGQDGLSERVVGRWMAERGTRDQVVLATKFRFKMGSGPNDQGASRYHILRSAEASLKRLGTDRLDLYQIHMQDRTVPEEETLRALDDLVRQGKVLYIGASNYAAHRLVDSVWTSRTQHLERFVALQAQYSLVERGLELEHVPACLSHGMGILPWSPLASGFLTGKYKAGQEPPAGARLAKWQDRFKGFDSARNWRILAAVEAVAAESGATVAQVSLAWLLRKPAVTSVIFGARSVAQLEDNLAAGAVVLTDAQVSQLDAASAVELGYPYNFIQRIQGSW